MFRLATVSHAPVANVACCLHGIIIIHNDVCAISYLGHFLIKKSVTFFSAAQKVRHSVRLGAELFPTPFGLLLLIVYIVLSLFMMMCALFPNSAIS